MFDAFDLNHDGRMSFDEYMIVHAIMNAGTLTEKLKYIFTIYDLDKNGFIERSEMLKMITAIAEINNNNSTKVESEDLKEEAERMFSLLDTNDDNIISINEFVNFCKTDNCITKYFVFK
jgi:Ca2+-binding EF-hand superfamily protein